MGQSSWLSRFYWDEFCELGDMASGLARLTPH
jgi:hypothetical protein